MKKPAEQRNTAALERIIATGSEIRATIEAMPERPPLRALSKLSEDATIQQVGELICWLIEQLNITNSMSDTQIESAALMIIETFPAFRLEDVALVMRDALKGKYGGLYNRLDVSLMLEWCTKHQDALSAARQARHYNAYLAQKQSRDTPSKGESETQKDREARLKFILQDKQIFEK